MTQETFKTRKRHSDGRVTIWTVWFCPECGKRWHGPEHSNLNYPDSFTCMTCDDPEPPKCRFVRDWAGRCSAPCEPDDDLCPEHKRKRYTCSCGQQAYFSCGTTMGPLVCGAPNCAGTRCTAHGGAHKEISFNG